MITIATFHVLMGGGWVYFFYYESSLSFLYVGILWYFIVFQCTPVYPFLVSWCLLRFFGDPFAMAQKHPTFPKTSLVALKAAQELGSPCSTDLQGEDEEVVVPFAAGVVWIFLKQMAGMGCFFMSFVFQLDRVDLKWSTTVWQVCFRVLI